MAARRGPGTRAETIHCEFCGEDYAVTYRRCPFCDGKPPAEDAEALDGGHRSGRRLAGESAWEGNTRGGGYGGAPSPLRIIGTVLSLALIVAAVCIVISIIKPLVDKGQVSLPESGSQVTTAPTPTPDPTPAVTPDAAGTHPRRKRRPGGSRHLHLASDRSHAGPYAHSGSRGYGHQL